MKRNSDVRVSETDTVDPVMGSTFKTTTVTSKGKSNNATKNIPT
jgi:hypothetical protein